MTIENHTIPLPYENLNAPIHLIRLPKILPNETTLDFPFAVIPSGGLQKGVSTTEVVVHEDVFGSLCRAQEYLSETYPDITIVLKRGYFPRDWVVRLKERVATGIFTIIYPHRKHEAKNIFSNKDWGHHSGFGVDIGLYDKSDEKYYSSFLPPKNAFSSMNNLRQFQRNNPKLEIYYQSLSDAVEKAGFRIHDNEIEARQMHIMLQENGI